VPVALKNSKHGRVEKFKTRQSKANKKVLSKRERLAEKREKRIKQKYRGLESLSQLRKETTKKK